MTAESQRSHRLRLSVVSFPLRFDAQRERGLCGRTGAPNRPRPHDAPAGRRGTAERDSCSPPRLSLLPCPWPPVYTCVMSRMESLRMAIRFAGLTRSPDSRLPCGQHPGANGTNGKVRPCRTPIPLPTTGWNRRSRRCCAPGMTFGRSRRRVGTGFRHRTWRPARVPHGRRCAGRNLEFWF